MERPQLFCSYLGRAKNIMVHILYLSLGKLAQIDLFNKDNGDDRNLLSFIPFICVTPTFRQKVFPIRGILFDSHACDHSTNEKYTATYHTCIAFNFYGHIMRMISIPIVNRS